MMQASVTYSVQTVAGGYLVSLGDGSLMANTAVAASRDAVTALINAHLASWVASQVPATVPTAALPDP